MEPKQPRHNSMPSTSMKSYVEAVKHNHTMKGKETEVPLSEKNGSEAPVASVTFQTANENTKWLDQLWVGRLKNKRDVWSVKNQMRENTKNNYFFCCGRRELDENEREKLTFRDKKKINFLFIFSLI